MAAKLLPVRVACANIKAEAVIGGYPEEDVCTL
jgi:hypothetical protein